MYPYDFSLMAVNTVIKIYQIGPSGTAFLNYVPGNCPREHPTSGNRPREHSAAERVAADGFLSVNFRPALTHC